MGIIVLIFALSCGNLSPLWMFINSLQLIVHIPLINSRLPSIANLYFLDYLSIIRLHFSDINEQISTYFGFHDAYNEDFRAIEEHDEYYNELIHQCGYSINLMHNLALILFLIGVFLSVWFILACKDFICFCGRRKDEALFFNFTVRFLYEMFFEVCLCLMISFSSAKFLADETKVTLFVSIALTVLAALALSYLGVLFCYGGPYIKDTYQKDSLKRSFW